MAPGDELASNAPEQHELSDVVEVAEAGQPWCFGSDRYMLSKYCRSNRQLDGFTDRAKCHWRKTMIVNPQGGKLLILKDMRDGQIRDSLSTQSEQANNLNPSRLYPTRWLWPGSCSLPLSPDSSSNSGSSARPECLRHL
jgi:hypothetical protein